MNKQTAGGIEMSDKMREALLAAKRITIAA